MSLPPVLIGAYQFNVIADDIKVDLLPKIVILSAIVAAIITNESE